jgi:hypothetical protein
MVSCGVILDIRLREEASAVAKALADEEGLETCVSAKRTGFI